jgi:hypothetical protein
VLAINDLTKVLKNPSPTVKPSSGAPLEDVLAEHPLKFGRLLAQWLTSFQEAKATEVCDICHRHIDRSLNVNQPAHLSVGKDLLARNLSKNDYIKALGREKKNVYSKYGSRFANLRCCREKQICFSCLFHWFSINFR